MKRSYVVDVLQNDTGEVCLKGWIHKISVMGKITFILLRDKTGIVQLVIEDMDTGKLRLEACIEVKGRKTSSDKAPGGVEIHVSSLKVLGHTYYDMLPFEVNKGKVKASLETQLDFRTISLRVPKIRAVFKVQHEIEEAFKNFLKGRGFSQIHTPKIISSATEGGSEMFTVDYFGRRAFLAQSPQFYKQMMVGAGFESVFEVGYAYRAELHNTWRHLNEYVSMDVEMAFIEDENDLMDLEEDYIHYLFGHLTETCKKELSMFDVTLKINGKIPRIPLAEAQEILQRKFNKKSPPGNMDAEGEILFSQYVKDTFGSDFVFLTKYPVSKRPMYTMPDPAAPGLTNSFDLIYKGLEITTGGQRIHDYEMLRQNIQKFGLDPGAFTFYLDSFKFGMPPHGGFAIGLERLTMKILNLSNIREAALFPRDVKRLEP